MVGIKLCRWSRRCRCRWRWRWRWQRRLCRIQWQRAGSAVPSPAPTLYCGSCCCHIHLAAAFNTFRELTLHLHVTMTRQHMAQRPHHDTDHRRRSQRRRVLGLFALRFWLVARGPCYVAVTAQPSDNRKVRPHISEIIITRDAERRGEAGEVGESSLTIESLQIL